MSEEKTKSRKLPDTSHAANRAATLEMRHHPKRLDLSGQKYNRLLIIKSVGKNSDGKVIWQCVCDCGNLTTAISNQLKNGGKVSCGCFFKEQLIIRNTKHNNSQAGNHSIEYTAWQNMKARCLNTKNKRYKNYGGRGIKVCDSWLNNFPNFLKDMGIKPTINHSVERKNTNGNYEPGNCKWALKEEQARNKTNNHWIEYNGIKMITVDWAKEFNCSTGQIKYFLDKGVPFDLIFKYYKNNFHVKKSKSENITRGLQKCLNRNA